jgi:hypothetical protein
MNIIKRKTKVKNLLTYTILIIVLASTGCGESKRELLIDGRWNINEASFNGNTIKFKAFEFGDVSIQLTMNDANGNPSVIFSEDSTINLPGISGKNIRAIWMLKEDILTLSIDSDFYSSIKVESGEKKPIFTNEFINAFNIYQEPFSVEIDGDILTLTSKTTNISLYKDKTIERMFNGL